MNIINSVQNPLENLTIPKEPPLLVLYYTCIPSDVDTVNRRIKNYVSGNLDITYNNSSFISTDTHFANGSNKGSFSTSTSIFASGVGGNTPQYAFTSSSRSISVSHWIKVKSGASKGFFPFDVGNGSGSSFDRVNAIIPIYDYNADSTGRLGYVELFANTVNVNLSVWGSNINMYNWNHIVIVYEHNRGAFCYINGVLLAQSLQAINITPFTTNSITGSFIPGLPSGYSTRMSCYLNELRIYNSALTASQVSQLYNWDGISTLNL